MIRDKGREEVQLEAKASPALPKNVFPGSFCAGRTTGQGWQEAPSLLGM